MNGLRFAPDEPGRIGADEEILWRGSPTAAGLISHAFPLRLTAFYFVVLAAWTLGLGACGLSRPEAVVAALRWIACGACVVLAVFAGTAALMATTTRYVITNYRVIFQVGVVVPIALTLPLGKISSAGLRLYPDGSGDIPLALGSEKLAYLLLWPHARPWHFALPQPMLRTVPCAGDVAAILSRILPVAHQRPGSPQDDKVVEPALI